MDPKVAATMAMLVLGTLTGCDVVGGAAGGAANAAGDFLGALTGIFCHGGGTVCRNGNIKFFYPLAGLRRRVERHFFQTRFRQGAGSSYNSFSF